ncbi:Stp1/IreP family PP2C-type Ser/Thr phosphatase [Oscillospiraceae bacterium PP1C4]
MKIYGGTDKGRVRVSNQDAYAFSIINESTAYVILCDGMGGDPGGHIASTKAVEVIEQALIRGLTPQLAISSIKPVLISAVTAANAVIFDMSHADERLLGMGTTVVVAVLREDTLCIMHAGDSRAYLISENAPPHQLTRDHSVVQLLVDSGRITEREARVHPKRNYITRALGVERTVELEYMEQKFTAGRLLICSDGLYNYAPPEEHTGLIVTCASEQDLFLLIDEANKAGGADNITAVIVSK